MRVGVFAVVLGFFGCRRVLNCLARSPAAPPPEPVANELGSFLADSLVTEMMRKAAMSTRTTWMATEATKPSPPNFCQNVRLERF